MANVPVSNLVKMRPFPTEQAAATAALNTARDESPNIYEWGGFIVKSGDTYSYTNPVSIGDQYEFAAKLGPLPANTEMVAIYHTHPSQDASGNKFSPHDVEVADNMKVNSYIWCEVDNTIRCYTPGHSSTYDYDMDDPFSRTKVSDGTVLK